jgi:hypothetical protein
MTLEKTRLLGQASYGMTSQECDLIRQVIETLRRLVPDDQGGAGDSAPPNCPVTRFVREYLASDPDADLTCEELWKFFKEVSQAGELPPMRKAAFLRQLPAVMVAIFGARKCHAIERGGHRVRGFRGVSIRLDACPATPEPV